jgi:hypothetical protein
VSAHDSSVDHDVENAEAKFIFDDLNGVIFSFKGVDNFVERPQDIVMNNYSGTISSGLREE